MFLLGLYGKFVTHFVYEVLFQQNIIYLKGSYDLNLYLECLPRHATLFLIHFCHDQAGMVHGKHQLKIDPAGSYRSAVIPITQPNQYSFDLFTKKKLNLFLEELIFRYESIDIANTNILWVFLAFEKIVVEVLETLSISIWESPNQSPSINCSEFLAKYYYIFCLGEVF